MLSPDSFGSSIVLRLSVGFSPRAPKLDPVPPEFFMLQPDVGNGGRTGGGGGEISSFVPSPFPPQSFGGDGGGGPFGGGGTKGSGSSSAVI